MHKILLAFACLVCTAHGRRVATQSQEPAHRLDQSKQALSKFLMAMNPASGFQPSGLAVRPPVGISSHAAPRPAISARPQQVRVADALMQGASRSSKKWYWKYLPNFRRFVPEAWLNDETRPWYVDYNTYGGLCIYYFVMIAIPWLFFSFLVDIAQVDLQIASNIILFFWSGALIFFWTYTYLFRVRAKDTSYARQLRDYEESVMAKRFEELDEDELEALLDEIYLKPEMENEEAAAAYKAKQGEGAAVEEKVEAKVEEDDEEMVGIKWGESIKIF